MKKNKTLLQGQKNPFIIITLVTAALLLSASLLLGHGIRVTLGKKYPFVLVNARYHGSQTLTDASVTVSFAAAAEKTNFQKGNTDKNGNFCFYPDKPGQWTVTVDDLTGHRGKQTLLLSEDFFNPPSISESENEKALPHGEKETVSPEPGQTENHGGSKLPGADSDLCCDLLKIVLGVLLILVVTTLFYRWRKRIESSSR
jgi:hypothetical protein